MHGTFSRVIRGDLLCEKYVRAVGFFRERVTKTLFLIIIVADLYLIQTYYLILNNLILLCTESRFKVLVPGFFYCSHGGSNANRMLERSTKCNQGIKISKVLHKLLFSRERERERYPETQVCYITASAIHFRKCAWRDNLHVMPGGSRVPQALEKCAFGATI